MSEDTLKIEFKSKLLSKNKKTEYENLYRKYVPEQDAEHNESSINYTGKKASYYANFFMIDSISIEKMIHDFDAAGATEIMVNTWHDTVGEELIYVLENNKILSFESNKEFKDYNNNDDINSVSELALLRIIKDNPSSILIKFNIEKKLLKKVILQLKSKLRYIFEENYVPIIESSFHDGVMKIIYAGYIFPSELIDMVRSNYVVDRIFTGTRSHKYNNNDTP